MYYASLLEGWTDGLKSNLLAEFTGFVFGTVVTLFGVNRLLELRERRRLAPLRARFAARVDTVLQLLSMFWGYGLSLQPAGERPAGPPVGVLRAANEIEQGLVERLRQSALTPGESSVRLLASHSIDLVHEITLAADRFSQLLTYDVALAEAVEEIEQETDEVRLLLRQEEMRPTDAGEQALAAGCLQILRQTNALQQRLSGAKAARQA